MATTEQGNTARLVFDTDPMSGATIVTRATLTREQALEMAFARILASRTRNKGTVTVHRPVTPTRLRTREVGR